MIKDDWITQKEREVEEQRKGEKEARDHLFYIIQQMEMGNFNRNEWSRLYKRYQRWYRRANGEDPRYNQVGVKPGRLSPEENERVEAERCLIEIRQILERANEKFYSRKRSSSSRRATQRDTA